MDAKLIVIVALLEGLMHYLPWRGLLRGQDLPRPAAYVFGVLGLMVPYGLWLYDRGRIEELQMLAGVIFFGGAIVLLLYLVDAMIDTTWRARHGEEREKELEGMRNVKG